DEGSEQYGTVDESIFKGFSVYYGENLTDYEIDQAERSEFTVFYGMQMYTSMTNGFDNMNHQFDSLGKKMDDGFDKLGKKMDDGFDKLGKKMDDGFDKLGKKMDDGFDKLGKKMDDGFDKLGKKMDDGFDKLGKKMDDGFDKLGKKIDNVNSNLGDKIDSMHTDMNTRFDTLDEKYGLISQTMLKLLEQQQEHNKKLDEILEMLTKRTVKKK
ncbi:MAG: hypothetical protein QXZ12_07010, partial [Thermoplasmata archaeon]